MIKTLQNLISIESIAEHDKYGFPYGPGPAKALEYVLNVCDNFGFKTKNANGIYGYAEIGEGDELIGILCHLDTVPAGSDWHYPPFESVIINDRIYGRGSIDDKGPTIACIYAMRELLKKGIPKKRIRIIFGQTEENGEWIDIDKYKEDEEMPSYGFTPDGDFPAIYCEKGLLLVKVTLPIAKSGFIHIVGGNAPNMVPDSCVAQTNLNSYETKGEAAHGSTPWLGTNAITALMKEIVKKEGLHTIPFADMYNTLIADGIYGENMNCNFCDEESGQLTVNAGKVSIEDNQICLYLDIRYPISCSLDLLQNIVTEKFSAFNATVTFIHHMPPVYIDKHDKVMISLLNAYREISGDMSEPIVIGGGTYARSMENIVAFGPNFPGHENREHKNDEYITVQDFENIFKIYLKALENLLEI